MTIAKVLKKHFSENLTEDIEKEINDVFEVIVAEKVAEKKKDIEAEVREEFAEKFEDYKDELEEKITTYIDKANEEFINENMKEVESATKVQLAEGLVSGVLTAIKEHNMNISIEDKDVIKTLEDDNKRLEESLNEAMEKVEEAKLQDIEKDKAIVVLKLTESLSEIQKQKVISIVEDVNTTNIDKFKEKVESAISVIKESVIKESDDSDFDENFDEPKVEKKSTDKYVPNFAFTR